MSDSETPQNAQPHLVIFAGSKPIHFPLTGSRVQLGRTGKNHIQIHRPNVSGCHLELRRRDDGQYEIEDLGSSNGTTVNGVSIGSCVLCDGDRIVVGARVAMHYLVVANPEESQAPVQISDVDLVEFQTFHEKLDSLAEQYQLLQRRMRRKTMQYEQLLESIVQLKHDPENAFRKIYGDGEVHFPVHLRDRFQFVDHTAEREEEVALPS